MSLKSEKDKEINENSELLLQKNGTSEKLEKDEEFHLYEADSLMRDVEITDDISCGYGFLRGAFLQRFANKIVYSILLGICGLFVVSYNAYFNASITTLEKRFKIPTKNFAFVVIGSDICTILISPVLSYYGRTKHIPRLMGFGYLAMSIICFMNLIPHFLYGPGKSSLELTEEFGRINNFTTENFILKEKSKPLCHIEDISKGCEKDENDNVILQIIFFVIKLFSGIGSSLYLTLASIYIDDNVPKSEVPLLISCSYFIKSFGAVFGYTLSSICLRIYIAPYLTPTITNSDPRWIGAWWMGWIALGVAFILPSFLLSLFPRKLPSSVVKQKLKKNNKQNMKMEESSVADMAATFGRILKNKIFLFSSLSSIFYYFGFTSFWTFISKYVEIQFKQTASSSNFISGTVFFVSEAFGGLLTGFITSKFKPKGRSVAVYNVICAFLVVLGSFSYSLIGCEESEKSMVFNVPQVNILNPTCNSQCHCDYVKYSPVCGSDGKTYISPCHAGCTGIQMINGKEVFTDCACITAPNLNNTFNSPKSYNPFERQSSSGPCKVNCYSSFITFMSVLCLIKFLAASSRATSFLIALRCVEPKDKSPSMGLVLTMKGLFAFIPSPIFFGWFFDKFCLVFGKTCNNKGNCWLYDAAPLRWYFNITICFIFVCHLLCDIGVWIHSKDLKIFDEDEECKKKGSNDM